MIEVRQTEAYAKWFESLRDSQASMRILARVRRLAEGNPGSQRALKGGVCEMKIDHGPGYRVYYTQRGNVLVILLCGGDKRTQQADIKTAMRLAKEV
jgi:putative addiction module killer protein